MSFSSNAIAGPSRPNAQASENDIFEEFASYPFSDDPTFKAGLPTIISAVRGQKRSAAQIDEMIARAQWFYFTRVKGVSIPWEAYVEDSQKQAVRPSLRSNVPSGSSPSPASPAIGLTRDPRTTIHELSEARKMMKADETVSQGREGDEGLSFAMLCRLISEGRADEVPGIQQIPDVLNPMPASQSILTPRAKPWEVRASPPGMTPFFTDPPLAPSPSTFDCDALSSEISASIDNFDSHSHSHSTTSPISTTSGSLRDAVNPEGGRAVDETMQEAFDPDSMAHDQDALGQYCQQYQGTWHG